jgi:hypothetical protein
MTEKEIKEKAEQIVEALTALSLGKEPNMLSGEVFKKLSGHQNFTQIKTTYITYLQSFDGGVDAPDDIKRMFDFRMEIVSLFDVI